MSTPLEGFEASKRRDGTLSLRLLRLGRQSPTVTITPTLALQLAEALESLTRTPPPAYHHVYRDGSHKRSYL